MKKIIVIKPQPHKVVGNIVTRKCEIERYDEGESVSTQILWFEFDLAIDFPDDKDSDSYLLAILFDAMHENRNIIIKGSVSGKLLSNLVEYQAAWHMCFPRIYQRVEIVADEIRENEMPAHGAVSAFSGGVDSTFTIWRHSQKKWGYRSQDIKLCVMVHGYDVPLSDLKTFEVVQRKASKNLAQLHIPLYVVKTNYRQISKMNWENTFACALVAALNNFKRKTGTCLIGSGHSYNYLDIGVGSSPVIDPLLSSGDFEVIHDGASHTRTQKIEEITEWKTGVENLRVCWEGSHKDRNCGQCEKCLRTMLCFLAIRKEIPSCFPNKHDILKNLLKIKSLHHYIKPLWKEVLLAARENKVDAPWVKVIDKLIYRKPIIDMLFPINSYRRNLVKNISNSFINR